MVALHGNDIVRVPIEDAVRELKTVPPVLLEELKVLFG
jgi:6-phosphofructokinase 1